MNPSFAADLPPITMPQPLHRPDISVVMCSHNGARVLPEALASLRRQSLADDRFEVIVVDDGSRDATARIADAWGARVIRLSPNRGLAAARNAGVSAAGAEIVAFTDDDCQAEPGWLAALLQTFADPAVRGVSGHVVPGGPDGFMLRYLHWRNPLAPLEERLLKPNGLVHRLGLYLRGLVCGERSLGSGDRLFSVVGANMAFRRELIYELGGFDEAFRFGGEEEDLCRRVHGLPGGGCLAYQPSATVIHHFEPRLLDTLRRSRAYGRGNARAAIKHPDARPILYPFPVVALAAAAVGVLTRRPGLARLGIALPVLSYPRWLAALRRYRSLEPLGYPYVQLAQEFSTMLGEFDGYRAGYAPVPSSQLSDDGPRTRSAE